MVHNAVAMVESSLFIPINLKGRPVEILEDFVLGTFREAIILKKLEFYDKLSQTGEGEGSVRFHTHIQKWSKNFENGPNGPKKSQIT